MRQQLFFEDRLKNFDNNRREADGSELGLLCGGFLRLVLLLRGAHLQGPGQFGEKGLTFGQVQGQCGS